MSDEKITKPLSIKTKPNNIDEDQTKKKNLINTSVVKNAPKRRESTTSNHSKSTSALTEPKRRESTTSNHLKNYYDDAEEILKMLEE